MPLFVSTGCCVGNRLKVRWPPEPTVLGDCRKNAYRHLLYHALLQIRNLCQSRAPFSWSPLEWYRQYRTSRDAGALADWLHNLADLASRDFLGFDEERFWYEHDLIAARWAYIRDHDYRNRFEQYLVRSAASIERGLLFIVGDAFVVNGQGLILAPKEWGFAGAQKGTEVEIRFPDGDIRTTTVVGIIIDPKPAIVIEPSDKAAESYIDAEVRVLSSPNSG